MANLGPIPVPDALAPVLPYVKFAVGLAGVVATVVVAVVAGPPAWVYVVISVATALGVLGAPNQQLASDVISTLKNVVATVQGGSIILRDVQTGDVKAIPADVNVVATDVTADVTSGETVVTDFGNLPKP